MKGNGWGQTWTVLTKYCRVTDLSDVAGRAKAIARNPRMLPGKSKKNRSNPRLRMIGTCGTWERGGQELLFRILSISIRSFVEHVINIIKFDLIFEIGNCCFVVDQ